MEQFLFILIYILVKLSGLSGIHFNIYVITSL